MQMYPDDAEPYRTQQDLRLVLAMKSPPALRPLLLPALPLPHPPKPPRGPAQADALGLGAGQGRNIDTASGCFP